MDAEKFKVLLHRLTGSPVKKLSDEEIGFLTKALSDDDLKVGPKQFNELLLIANKDRVDNGFFGFFFCTAPDCKATSVDAPVHRHECLISELGTGVERFQRYALLRFGNFKFAYRELSRAEKVSDVRAVLGNYATSRAELEVRYAGRPKKMVRVEKIDKQDTYLVGYLSGREITADMGRALEIERYFRQGGKGVAQLEVDPKAVGELGRLNAIIEVLEWQAASSGARPAEELQSALELLKVRQAHQESIQARGRLNTSAYLTWDYMDLYFATSMRERWEYEELHDFIYDLMHREELTPLQLRYFDPTVSFEESRIDKGLVEALMLKRARCTVYSIQLSDTLGKDSELAATLAQGKPVIAYAPKHDLARRASDIEKRPLVLLRRFDAFWSDPEFRDLLESKTGAKHRETFESAMATYYERWPWASIENEELASDVLKTAAASISFLSRAVADAEERSYEKRVKTLGDSHPLGIQVNLESGVANGVLVTRDLATCAKLVRGVLLNDLKLELLEKAAATLGNDSTWLLQEKETRCVYRVVTGNPKLTNCFWNFYRRSPIA